MGGAKRALSEGHAFTGRGKTSSGGHRSDVLYQGTTLVGPFRRVKDLGFLALEVRFLGYFGRNEMCLLATTSQQRNPLFGG
jgi:hypothetical protein